MYKEAINTIRVMLSEDDKFRSFNTVLARIRNEFNYARCNEELMQLMAERHGRKLWLEPSIPQSDKITKAVLQNGAHRSRAVELAMPLRRFKRTAEKGLKAIRAYIMVEYENEFAGIRHKTDKELAIEVLMQPAEDLITELENVIEGADQLIQDIDQNGFATRDTKDILIQVHRNIGVGGPG